MSKDVRVNIAILEDDTDQLSLLSLWLEDAGYSVAAAQVPSEFLDLVGDGSYDLLVLDWMLPEMNGLEVLNHLRFQLSSKIPVVFLTVNDRESDVVAGLQAGADDYIIKPAVRDVFLARINAVLRRSAPHGHDGGSYGPYRIDASNLRIEVDGKPVQMTKREFDLAVFLFQHVGKLLSRDLLLREIWGVNDHVQTRTLDTHISRLRQKLGFSHGSGWVLNSIYRYGYRLEQTPEAD